MDFQRQNELKSSKKTANRFDTSSGLGDGAPSPQPPVDIGLALRIEFDKPLDVDRLPLTLGYASHFGLGLFSAINNEKDE